MNEDSSKSPSVEESDNFSTDVSLSGFLVGEDALVGGEDDVTELSGGEDVAGPLLELAEGDVVSGGDDTALVETSREFNDNLVGPVVVDNFKFANVA